MHVTGAVPYTGKLSSRKTFAIGTQNYYSRENFRGASGHGHHVLYTASDSRGKLSRLTEKPRKTRKFSHSKVFPYTVYTRNSSNWLESIVLLKLPLLCFEAMPQNSAYFA